MGVQKKKQNVDFFFNLDSMRGLNNCYFKETIYPVLHKFYLTENTFRLSLI
jgi:hypothetical protein